MIWSVRSLSFALFAALSLAAATAAGYAGASAALHASPASAGASGTPIEPASLPARDALPGPYRASVLRVIDGDTFEARLRVWFGQDVTVAVRIRGFDAPELKSKCPRDVVLAQEAQAALADILASGPLVLREIGRDKYGGRVVASVEIATLGESSARENIAPENVAALMIAGGYGRAYDGRARPACVS